MGFLHRIFRRRPVKDLEEWSTNFDAGNVGPFLQQIAPHIASGFGELEIQRIVELVASTPHDETNSLELRIEFRSLGRNFDLRLYG